MADEIIEALDKELRRIADLIFTKSQENLNDMGISDTGFLLKSGSLTGDNLKYTITYNAPYAEAVEYGSDPHTVPFEAIYKWVRRKLGIKRDKEATAIAWAIIKHIQAQGIQPKPFLRNSLHSVLNTL